MHLLALQSAAVPAGQTTETAAVISRSTYGVESVAKTIRDQGTALRHVFSYHWDDAVREDWITRRTTTPPSRWPAGMSITSNRTIAVTEDEALDETDRPMLYSLCNPGGDHVHMYDGA